MDGGIVHIKTIRTQTVHNGSTRRKQLISAAERRRGNIATMNYAWMRRGHVMDVHIHPDGEEIYLFLGGQGEILIGDSWQRVSRGDFVVIPSGTAHSIRNRQSSKLTYITIRTVRSDP